MSNKAEVFNIRFTSEDMAAIRAAAKILGTTPSKFIRDLVTQRAHRIASGSEEAISRYFVDAASTAIRNTNRGSE